MCLDDGQACWNPQRALNVNIVVLLISVSFVAIGCYAACNGADTAKLWPAIAFFGGGSLIAAWDVLQAIRQRTMPSTNSPESHNRFYPLIIKRSGCQLLVYAVACASMGFAGVPLVASGEAPVLGWIAVLFFGGGSLVLAWHFFDVRPRLVIDAEGIYDRTLGVGTIAWKDIEDAYICSIHVHDFICLVVHDPDVYLRRLSAIRRKIATANRALGLTELNLNLVGVTASAEEVLQLIYEHLPQG